MKQRFGAMRPALSSETLAELEKQGFRFMTPVQAAAIPLLCTSKDVAVDAATGSGKTLAFVVPTVEILRRLPERLKPHQVGAVIISPTRELASQISHVAAPFLKTVSNLSVKLLVGGTDVSMDLRNLEESGGNVLIGTPGRLFDVMERSTHLDFRQLEVLILDEADRLLEMGFQRQLSGIIQRLPKQRRTGLFSATQTQAVEELAKAGLRNPVRVEVKTERKADGGLEESSFKTPAGLNVEYLICDADEKPSQLAHFLLQNASRKIIVYFVTCASVDYWGTALPDMSILRKLHFTVLHGKLKQRVREKALEKFSNMPAGVLFCTDVAARGLDIPGVDWVVQYDAPQDPNMFVHRVGRTARMGRSGDSVVFLYPKEDTYVEFLRIRNIPLKETAKAAGVENVIPMLRAAALEDRDVMEKGLKAFVSYFRAYKEHQCSFIFQWKQLDIGKVGMGFGLLRLPSMPELRRGVLNAEHFEAIEGLDLDAIKYKDKAREKLRRKKLEEGRSTARPARKQAIAKHPKRGAKDKDTKLKRTKKNKRTLRDHEEINNEYRLMKKVKKGTMSEEQFEKLTDEAALLS